MNTAVSPSTRIAQERRKALLLIAVGLDGFTINEFQHAVDEGYREHEFSTKSPTVRPIITEWLDEGLLYRVADTAISNTGKTVLLRYHHYWVE